MLVSHMARTIGDLPCFEHVQLSYMAALNITHVYEVCVKPKPNLGVTIEEQTVHTSYQRSSRPVLLHVAGYSMV